MKKAGTKMTRDWSKRSALQYAYSTVMNIDPDDIKKIEEERDAIIKKETEGLGILGYIEKRAEIEDNLPKLPDIPDDLNIKFMMAMGVWDTINKPKLNGYYMF